MTAQLTPAEIEKTVAFLKSKVPVSARQMAKLIIQGIDRKYLPGLYRRMPVLEIIAFTKSLRKCTTEAHAYQSVSPILLNLTEAQAKELISTRMYIAQQDYFNIENGLRREQCVIFAELLREAYGDLKLCELDIILRRAVTGQYGPTYNRIDVASCMDWVAQYYKARTEIFCMHREAEHIKRKGCISPERLPQQYSEKTPLTDKQKQYQAKETQAILDNIW